MKHKNNNDLILREDVLKEIDEWISSGECHAFYVKFLFLINRIKRIEKRGELNEDNATIIRLERQTSEKNDRI